MILLIEINVNDRVTSNLLMFLLLQTSNINVQLKTLVKKIKSKSKNYFEFKLFILIFDFVHLKSCKILVTAIFVRDGEILIIRSIF